MDRYSISRFVGNLAVGIAAVEAAVTIVGVILIQSRHMYIGCAVIAISIIASSWYGSWEMGRYFDRHNEK